MISAPSLGCKAKSGQYSLGLATVDAPEEQMKTGCLPNPSDMVRQSVMLMDATFSVKSIMGRPAKASAA
eukprot:7732279-Heterocapsa_arctica.AAC.1